jgi:hypothetical protein
LTNSKPCDAPLDPSLPLLPAKSDDKLANPASYQELTGSLNHLAITSRPDIAFSVSRLCQFNSKPTFTHLKAARRVLRYAIHTRNYSIKYCGDGFLELELLGFADADYVISSIVGPLRATSSSSAAMRYPDSPGNNRPWRYLRWRPSIWPYLMQFASSFRM